MKKKTRTLLLTGFAGVGLLALTVLQVRSAPASIAPTAPPTTATLEGAVAAEGRVVAYPGAEVRVSAERPGRLVRVLFEEGQRVRRGELLAEIDASELRASLQESRARIREAEAEIRLAQADLTRRRDLVAQGVAAARDLDQAERDQDTARARRDTASAEAERIEAQLQKTRILAPIDGTVTAREVDAGETVETGDPVASIVDLDRLRVDAEADEADAGAVALGRSVQITADGYPGVVWRGTVEQIGDAVTLRKLKPQDPARPTDTRVLSVKVAFAEPTPLKLGTTVELRIARAQTAARMP